MGAVMEKLPIPTSLPTKLQAKMEEAFCDRFPRERKERETFFFFFFSKFLKGFSHNFSTLFLFSLNFLSILPQKVPIFLKNMRGYL